MTEALGQVVDLTLWQVFFLAGAGFVAGVLNAAAGGGSLVSFPVLIAVGYPPLMANVTNNVAAVPGYAGGAWGYRRGLSGQRKRIVTLAATSVLGSVIGVALILVSSGRAFSLLAPFLVLAACGLLAVQPYLGRLLEGRYEKADRPGAGSLVAQTLAAAYGGYFGAAMGVAVLALLNVSLEDTLQRLNALKALLQFVIGGVAAVGFAVLTSVAWTAVLVMVPFSLVGGQAGAWLAQRISEKALRVGIIAFGTAAAIWLLLW